MAEFQNQMDLINNKISIVSHSNPPPYIHCSKINCFLQQIKELHAKVFSVKTESNKKMTNTIRNNISSFVTALVNFQQLHAQCCGEICAQFALTSSMRNVRNEISAIRKECMKCLDNIGLKNASSYLQLDDNELDSQDKVDIKRIAVILNHLQMRPELAKREEVAHSLRSRLNSLDALGINLNSDESGFETISFPDLPSSLNYIVKYEDIKFGGLIGEGEAGKVYKGKIKTKDQTDIDCAVKILHRRSLSTYDVEMYRREIFSMSVLRHPSLVKFCGYTTEPPFCLLTEYMENGSLHDFLHRNPKDLTPTDKTLIALDIARGLEFLHGRGVIHRDLKSLNILLDSRKRAKICDFGLIRMKSKDPMTGLVGTSFWMAPEVLMSSPYYDQKVDIYSFGILMWELLTSERPYENENLDATHLTLQIIEKFKRPPIPPNTPLDLKSLIESCWSQDPNQRPTCHEIIEKLSRPSFQFPGSELVLMIQERNLRQNVDYCSFSPIPIICHNFVKNKFIPSHRPIGFKEMKIEKLDQLLKRITDSLSNGHIEHFENALSHFRESVKFSKITFNQYSGQLLEIIKELDGDLFQLKLVRFFFELMNEDTGENDELNRITNSSLIAKLIRSKNPQISEITISNISSHPFEMCFTEEILDALFEFSLCKDQQTRSRALLALLQSVDFLYEEIIKLKFPRFTENILKFTGRTMPVAVLQLLLEKILTILKGIQEVTPFDVERLAKIMLTTPKNLRNILCNCIETVMIRFSTMREYSDFFINAIEDYESYGSIFQTLNSFDTQQEPTREMLSALAVASEHNDEAFSILIDFISRFDFSCNFVVTYHLPIKNKNEKLLTSFYEQILQQNKKSRNNSPNSQKNDAFSILSSSEVVHTTYEGHNFFRPHRTSSDVLIQNYTDDYNDGSHTDHENDLSYYYRNGSLPKHDFVSVNHIVGGTRLRSHTHTRTNSIPFFSLDYNNEEDDGEKNIGIRRISSQGASNMPLKNHNNRSMSTSTFSFFNNIEFNSNDILLKNEEFYRVATFLLDSPTCFNQISSILSSKQSNPLMIQETPICETIAQSVINEIREREFLNLMFHLSCNYFFPQFVIAVPKLFSNLRNSKDKEVVRLSFLCLALISKSNTDQFDFELLLKHAAKAVNTQKGGFYQTASSFIIEKFIDKISDNSFLQDLVNLFLDTYIDVSKPSSIVAEILVNTIKMRETTIVSDDLIQKLQQINDTE